jgi:class 3 adenylate cyclase
MSRQGVELRAGLHTGEVEPHDDGFSGIAVTIGARVAALAGAGEVLVSSTVRDLVVGSALSFEDRGVHHLKEVPEPWHLYALTNSA